MPALRPSRDDGFTFVELLVVILVLGILAAIALPAFLSQRTNAQDANAKALAATGANAMETYRVEHDDYAATRADVLKVAPELSQAPSWTLDAHADRYDVRVTSRSGTWFEIGRPADGEALERHCSARGDGGCLDDGSW